MLVIALFIVALVSAIAVAMMSRLDRDVHRTKLILNHVQAEDYADGSYYWALAQLTDNINQQKPGKLVDTLPLTSPIETMNGYKIYSIIEDLQARFNINNLQQKDWQEDFLRLIHIVDPSLNNDETGLILQATLKRMNISNANSSAKQLFTSVSEWRQVPGVSSKLYDAMRPYLVALPKVTQINIQTAEAPVIESLSENMNAETANAIIQLRTKTPIISAENLTNNDMLKNHPIPTEKLTFISQYFLIETVVSMDDQKTILYTLLERKGEKGKVEFLRHWQSKGLW